MGTNRNLRRIATRAVAVGIAATAFAGLSTTAAMAAPQASSEQAAIVVAAEPQIIAASPVLGPKATASGPRQVTVTGHDGRAVSLVATGEQTRGAQQPAARPVTFKNLTAGRDYTVLIGGRAVAKVTAVDRPQAASGLVVRTNGDDASVALAWTHQQTPRTGGARVQYELTASTTGSDPVRTTVTGERSGVITGLDPKALYAFTVTPRNGAGSGPSTTATMTRSLAAITGTSAKADPAPAPAPTPTPAPEAPRAAAPAPAPANPGPSTRTIYVCPAGFADSGDLCTQARAYTYHDGTETQPYSYHSEFVETSRTWRNFGTDWTGNHCPNGGTWHDGACVGWDVQGNYVAVKDAPPAGWSDNGTSYERTIKVKDSIPAGFTDDGSQWVKSAAKEPRTVTA